MNSRLYPLVSGCIFAVVGIAHILRGALRTPLVIAGVDIPVWISWPAGVCALAMCAWALGSGRPSGRTT